MKSELLVLLSEPAIKSLKPSPTHGGAALVFLVASGAPLPDMTLIASTPRLKVDSTPHGFRANFAKCAQGRRVYPSEVRTHALAHAFGNETTGPYALGNPLAGRNRLMKDWATLLQGVPLQTNKSFSLRAA